MTHESDQLPKELHAQIFQEEILKKRNFTDASPNENPKAIILAGQPGAGKGGLARQARAELSGNVVNIDPDQLRDDHPTIKQFRRENPYTWSGRTHADASQWADELLDATSSLKKSLIFDTTLSNGEWASDKLIKGLQAKGYEVEIRVIASPKLESELGVDQRFTELLSEKGHSRYVPEGARDAIYPKLPASLDTIHANTNVTIRIFNREGAELYNSGTDPRLPGLALEEERIVRLKDPRITQALREGWEVQADFHRDLPRQVQDIPNTDAATQSKLLTEHRELKINEGVAARAEGIATVDELVRPGAPPARAPVPEPAIPGLHRAGMTAGLAGVGIAASAYDAHQTGQRVDTLLRQDNPTAAQSELTHFGARGIGGWAAGTATLAALGTSSGGALALAAADAWLLSEAFDRGAMLLDNRRIYHQTDRDGVTWDYNGTHWTEQRLADLQDDDVDRPQQQAFFALPEKARELNYLANYEAIVQAMGKVHPRNPHVQPAGESDRAHLFQRDWVHDAATGAWSRSVADEVNRNDQPLWNVEEAGPERVATLGRQALQTIDHNIATGAADLAARYQRVYHRNGESDFGPMPPAVQTALDQDNLQAANGKHYHRDQQGQWWHDGEQAQGNTALELDITRQRLRPALEQHAQALTAAPAYQPPTPEQQDHANMVAAYRGYGVNPNPEQWQAIQLAVQRTREAHGLESVDTALALGRDANGQYTKDSPVQHLRRGDDGVIRGVATTSHEEIERALSEIRGRDLSTSDPGAPAQPVAPPASSPPPPDTIEAERDSVLRQQEQQQLQREEQRHSAAIQAASQQRDTTRNALDSGLSLADPDHPAHHDYEQARRGVVELYSQQGKVPDDRVEPMAAALVAQAQRDGLSNINAVMLSDDNQHLIASNTREVDAAHRETAQLPVAQAASQSVADSSQQWATHQIAQAQERMQAQERAQAYAPALERTSVRTPAYESDRQAEAQRAAASFQAQPSYDQSQRAVQQVWLQRDAVREQGREREDKHLEIPRQDAYPGALPARATDDVAAPEHRQDQRMAPSAQSFPSHPEQAPIAQADPHPEARAGVERIPLSHMPAQVEERASYATPIQRGRSADEDAKAQQPEPRYEAGHRRDPDENAPSTNHAAAIALASGKDPRHPDHPDHALHQQIRHKTEALCESQGIPLVGEQLDRVAACLTAEAKRVKISSADHVLFSERPGTREIGDNLIVAEGDLDKPGMRFSFVVAREAAQTPIAASFDKLEQVNQIQAMQQQQQLAQEQEQQQKQEEGRSVHRMVM